MELMERRRILLNTPHINIVTGLQFVTDMVAPIESLVINFSPIQDLHGYDNPWPAGGGKNRVYKTLQGCNIGPNGAISSLEGFDLFFAKVESGKTYTISVNGVATRSADVGYFADDPTLGSITYDGSRILDLQATFVATYSGYLGFRMLTDTANVQLEEGSATSYAPYSNICPISGRTGLDVTITGKNLCMAPVYGLPPSYSDIVTWSTKPTNYTTLAKRLNELGPGDYVMSCDFTLVTRNDISDNSTHGLYLLFNDGTSFGNHNLVANRWGTKTVGATDTVSLPITITESTAGTIKDLRFYGCGINGIGATGSASVSNFQVEKGSTATAYEPYQGTTYPISWQTEAGTVYGGTIDVTTGLLTVDKAKFTASINDTLLGITRTSYGWAFTISTSPDIYKWQPPSAIAIPAISTINVPTRYNLATVSGFANIVSSPKGRAVFVLADETSGLDANSTQKEITNAYYALASANDVSVVYPLYEPITYQLTPQQVLAFKGINNLSMSGQVKFWTHID